MNDGLVGTLMSLPLFEAEWVLWLLILMSLVSIGLVIERIIFFFTRNIDATAIRGQFAKLLDQGDYDGAAKLLAKHDSLETNVVLFGLRDHHKGPDAVEDLIIGAMGKEKQRYERFLSILGTVGSNAPFIGLFGTVLGIIRAFADLAGNIAEASNVVMAGISEALIATAVGLLVAIPAVIAHNAFRTMLKTRVGNTDLLARTLLAQLKAEE
jgi:biopolymer transport protein ExbB/TolQ